MSRVIDLTYPLEEHFRWTFERSLVASHQDGDPFQITSFGLRSHGFTHIDAPRHLLADGATTSDFDLNQLVGEAAIVDLSGIANHAAIADDELTAAGEHVREGDIVFLKTAWDERYSLGAKEFWTEAPYLTRGACEWLLRQRPAVVGYDFPQDEPIRHLLDGVHKPIEEFVSHDVLLRQGIPMIEYLCNLGEITTPRAAVSALPLKVLDADGAPIRVVAVER